MARLSVTLLLSLLFVSISSCDWFEDALPDINVDVNGSSMRFTVPQSDEPGTYTLTQQIDSDVVAELDAQDIDDDRVKAIKLESAVFSIASPASPVDFSIIDAVEVTVKAPGRSTINFAERDLTSVSGDMITLNVADVDLLETLLAPQAEFTVILTTNAAVPEPTDIEVEPQYSITVRPL